MGGSLKALATMLKNAVKKIFTRSKEKTQKVITDVNEGIKEMQKGRTNSRGFGGWKYRPVRKRDNKLIRSRRRTAKKIRSINYMKANGKY